LSCGIMTLNIYAFCCHKLNAFITFALSQKEKFISR
jgi:hypothetical protein